MSMTFGSLFAGIGGLDLGLERAGMKCAWQVEIDDYANKVLAKHWPDVDRFRDVRECGAENLRAVDLIYGGFPCQDVSLAGKRAGLEGERTTLWSEFARIIRELKPRWVLAENVPGLLSSDGGRFFGNVLRDLAALGYVVEWDCIPAAAVGAPHRRDRVFIVAHAGVIRRHAGGAGESLSWAWLESSAPVADAAEPGLAFWQDQAGLRQFTATVGASQWAVEPGVGRVASRISARVDRLRCLGNAVVPQVAEFIGRIICQRQRAKCSPQSPST